MGLYFSRAAIGLSTGAPNRDRIHDSIVHLGHSSSIDEQTRIIVGDLVFVRAKFISEGVGFRVFTQGNPIASCFLRLKRSRLVAGRICNPGSHLYSAPIPGGHNVFT